MNDIVRKQCSSSGRSVTFVKPWYDIDELHKEIKREHERAMLEWLYKHYPELRPKDEKG